MTLGERLRKLRELNGLAQRQIGALIDVDGAFISKVENGDKPLNRNHLSTLANYFKVDEEELQILWLADKIYSLLNEEKLANKVLKEVSNRI